MYFIKFLVFTLFVLSISNVSFGKTPQFYSVGECHMRTMKNKNLTGNRMFDVVHKKCEKKINVTKTDIIEHKGELVRNIWRRERLVVWTKKDRGHMTLPFTNTLPPEFWKGD